MTALKTFDGVLNLQNFFLANFSYSGSADIEVGNPPPADHTNQWLRMTVLMGDTNPNLDSSWERVTGIVNFRTFTPAGMGEPLAYKLAEACADTMKYKQVGIIRLTSASIQNMGDQGNEWYRVDVQVPFFWERTTS